MEMTLLMALCGHFIFICVSSTIDNDEIDRVYVNERRNLDALVLFDLFRYSNRICYRKKRVIKRSIISTPRSSLLCLRAELDGKT